MYDGACCDSHHVVLSLFASAVLKTLDHDGSILYCEKKDIES